MHKTILAGVFVAGIVVLHVHYYGTGSEPDFSRIEPVNVRFAADAPSPTPDSTAPSLVSVASAWTHRNVWRRYLAARIRQPAFDVVVEEDPVVVCRRSGGDTLGFTDDRRLRASVLSRLGDARKIPGSRRHKLVLDRRSCLVGFDGRFLPWFSHPETQKVRQSETNTNPQNTRFASTVIRLPPGEAKECW